MNCRNHRYEKGRQGKVRRKGKGKGKGKRKEESKEKRKGESKEKRKRCKKKKKSWMMKPWRFCFANSAKSRYAPITGEVLEMKLEGDIRSEI